MIINWYKFNPEAKLPTKRAEDAGFDIYTIEDNVILQPFEKRLFATGLGAAPTPGYWLMAMDRGSTGSRGIHTHCGIIDNGYRGEIFICLCNDNPYPVKFTSKVRKPVFDTSDGCLDKDGKQCCGEILYYPISKGIAQIIPIPQPEVTSCEVDAAAWEELCNTERGEGKLGASGKQQIN